MADVTISLFGQIKKVWRDLTGAGTQFAASVVDHAYNGATYDQMRSNLSAGTVLAADMAAASAGVNGPDQVNYNGRGLHLIIDVTAITGTTPTLTVTIQGKDAKSGKYYTILASAAISTVSTTVLRVYPGLTAAANATANDALPRDWRVITAIGGTTPAVTGTISAAIIN